MTSARAFLFCWLWLVLAGHSYAQATREAPASVPLPPVQNPAPGPAAPAATTLPPYESRLERLAELMGSLAYLRDLCGKGDGAEWHGRMSALLDAEASTQSRRERLAGAYNQGFRGYQTNYRSCTPSAELVILRFLAEGDRLARDISTRFGGE